MRTSLLAALVLVGCGAPAVTRSSTTTTRAADDPTAEWEAWRAERRESLAGEDGWLTLIGLHWLDDPSTTIGSDEGAGIVLPIDRAPARVGTFAVRDGVVWFAPEPGVAIAIEGVAIDREIALTPDDPGPPTTLELGSLRLHVIARAGRLAVRIKDRESPARLGFEGPPVYDHDPRFRVRAELVRAEGETLPIVNVLGQQVDEPLAGRLRLELDGQPIELLATAAGDAPEEGLFVMFRDATSDLDDGTYPAGRYLEVAAPDETGATWIDFNYAYTPPCGFTTFATCPLPPPENEIAIAITAGERAPH